MKKPYKGKIYCWKKRPFNVEEVANYYGEMTGLGYVIVGYLTPVPKLGSFLRTSWVVKHYKNGSIETRNSRYKLVGKEQSS